MRARRYGQAQVGLCRGLRDNALQRRGVLVDGGLWPSVPWLVGLLGLVAGVVVGRPAVIPAITLLALASVALWAWPRRSRAAALVLVGCLGGARGGAVDGVGAPPPGLWDARVLDGAFPGWRCRLHVQGVGGPWRLDVPAGSDCRWQAGDGLRVAIEGGRVRRVWPDRAPRSPLASVLEVRREWGWRWGLGDAARGVVAASVFGLRDAVPERTRDRLRRAGLGHLLAISGLHVGLCAVGIAWLLMRALPGWPRVALALGVVPVGVYMLLTGGSPSSVRACGTFAVLRLAALVGRPVPPRHALLVAVVALLAWEPRWLTSAGMHLSVAALIVLTAGRYGTCATVLRLHLALIPILLCHFGAVPTWGALCNVVVIPIFEIAVMPFALVGAALGPELGHGCLDAAAAGVRLILGVGTAAAAAPPTTPFSVALVGAGLWLLRRRLRLGALGLAVLAWFALAVWPARPRVPSQGVLVAPDRGAAYAHGARLCVLGASSPSLWAALLDGEARPVQVVGPASILPAGQRDARDAAPPGQCPQVVAEPTCRSISPRAWTWHRRGAVMCRLANTSPWVPLEEVSL